MYIANASIFHYDNTHSNASIEQIQTFTKNSCTKLKKLLPRNANKQLYGGGYKY